MTAKKSVGILVSGGLDSVALVAHYLERGYDIWPIYVRCGLRWEKLELYWLKRFLKAEKSQHCQPLRILRLSLENAYQKNWSQTGIIPGARSHDSAVFLPARNLLLATKALLSLHSNGVSQIALGTLKGNPFKDASSSYFLSLQNLLSISFGRKIYIHAPFRTTTKAQIINKYNQHPLHLSFSCINPKERMHCGQCNKCAERKKAFREAGVGDKTIYLRNRKD